MHQSTRLNCLISTLDSGETERLKRMHLLMTGIFLSHYHFNTQSDRTDKRLIYAGSVSSPGMGIGCFLENGMLFQGTLSSFIQDFISLPPSKEFYRRCKHREGIFGAKNLKFRMLALYIDHIGKTSKHEG